jgi:hypothetical protein|tara:strand:+ start:685 stop:852 length:168 start_codon:yes stop_codon:yes gene_type:complete
LKKILIFIFLASCSSPNSLDNSKKSNFGSYKDLSFDDFNSLLLEYSKRTPYPRLK